MKKNCICLILIISIHNAFSQVKVTRKNDNLKGYDRRVIFTGGPAYSSIRNENIKNDKYAETRGVISPNFGLNYVVPVSNEVSYIFGLEYSRFVNITAYKGYFKSSELKRDISGGQYYPLVEADYTTKLVLNSFDLPFCMRMEKCINENVTFFADAGFKLNVVISYAEYKNGVYNQKALYPNNMYSNVFLLVENDPIFGFVNTTYTNLKRDVSNRKLVASALFAIGLNAKTSSNSFLNIGFMGVFGLTDINSNNSAPYVNVFGEKSLNKKYSPFQLAMKIGYGVFLR